MILAKVVGNIVATPTGLLAVGSETSYSASIWVSDNGTEWTRASNDRGIFGNDHGPCFRCPGEGDYISDLASKDGAGAVMLWAHGIISFRPNPVTF